MLLTRNRDKKEEEEEEKKNISIQQCPSGSILNKSLFKNKDKIMNAIILVCDFWSIEEAKNNY